MSSTSIVRSPVPPCVLVLAFYTLSGASGQTPTPAFKLEIGNLSPIETPAPAPSVEQKYSPPKVVKREPVSYPELAHLNRVEGVVRVRFSVDDTGRVETVFAEKSSGSVMLDQVVLDPRLKQWVFQPATLDGKPISATVVQEFEFRLDPTEERTLAAKRLSLPFGTAEPPYPPEAAAKGLRGNVTIGVYWEKENGLVDKIYLIKSSGSGFLDGKVLRFAYENWRVDPASVTAERFVKTIEYHGS